MDKLKKLQLIFQTLSDYNRLGILKSIVWPAFLVYGLLKFLGI